MSATKTEWRTGVQKHRQQMEERIVRATAELLGSHGLDALTIDLVMESTGLTRTAFYRYFPSIDRVIARLLGEIVSDVEAGAGWQTEPLDSDFAALFEHQAKNLAATYARHGSIFAALSDATEANPEVHAMWEAALEHRIELAVARIREFQAAGLVRDLDAELVGTALALQTHHLLLRCYRHPSDLDPDHVGATLAELWIRSVFDTSVAEEGVLPAG